MPQSRLGSMQGNDFFGHMKRNKRKHAQSHILKQHACCLKIANPIILQYLSLLSLINNRIWNKNFHTKEGRSRCEIPPFFRFWCDLHMSLFPCVCVFALDKLSASDWLRRQFLAVVLASQSEVACICILSAFYHMAKQHSKEVSTQTTDGTTVQSSVQYI